MRRGKSEEWKVRWDKEALRPGEWGTGSEKTSGGMVAKELRAVNEGSKEITNCSAAAKPKWKSQEDQER